MTSKPKRIEDASADERSELKICAPSLREDQFLVSLGDQNLMSRYITLSRLRAHALPPLSATPELAWAAA